MNKSALVGIYLAWLFLLAWYGSRKAYYNWDMIPYMAVVLGYEDKDLAQVHDSVYSLIRQELPANSYQDLADGGLAYRRTMARSAADFRLQLPFYLVKPLYTGMAYVFYKTGIPLVQATILPSALGFILCGLLFFAWLLKYLSPIQALAFSMLVMVSGPFWEMTRYSTPDSISSCLLLAALYCILERKSLRLIFLFLFLSVFARLDNIIPSVLLLTLARFLPQWGGSWKRNEYVVMTLTMIASFFVITARLSPFGWNPLYYPTFVKWLNTSYSFQPVFHFRSYFSLAASQLMTGLFFSYAFLFAALAVLAASARWNAGKSAHFEQFLLVLFGLIVLVRFILQPVMADRFYVPYYLTILILLVHRVAASRQPAR